MKIGTWILAGIVTIVALRLAVQVGALLILVLVMLALVRAPSDTLKVLFALVAIGAFARHPIAAFALLALLIITGHSVKR